MYSTTFAETAKLTVIMQKVMTALWVEVDGLC
jgi:hypothetical protein